jgi:hypothetical protein
MNYIHSQDDVDVFIGPFPSEVEAQYHIDTVMLQRPRTDTITFKLIDEYEFNQKSPGWLVVTPEEDVSWDPEDSCFYIDI